MASLVGSKISFIDVVTNSASAKPWLVLLRAGFLLQWGMLGTGSAASATDGTESE